MALTTFAADKDNLIAFVHSKLDADHKRVFADNFLLTLVDTDDAYPISGELAMAWLGYAQWVKCKALIERCLTSGTDYKVIFSRPGKNLLADAEHGEIAGQPIEHRKSAAGRPAEHFSLTVDAFKKLGMHAKTGAGELIRSYYLELEKLIFEYGLQQQRKLLEDAIARIEEAEARAAQSEATAKNTQVALGLERQRYETYKKRRYHNEPPGERVYIRQYTPTLFKIGSTKHMSKRESNQRSVDPIGEIIYVKKCYNEYVLEKVVHLILDQYRDLRDREYFTGPLEVFKAAVDAAHIFIDGLVNNCAGLGHNNFVADLAKLVDAQQTTKAAASLDPNSDSPDGEESAGGTDEADTEEESAAEEVDISDVRDPFDYDKFIRDCCIKGDDFHVHSVDIFGAHRLWSRTTDLTNKVALRKYLDDNFKTAKIYVESMNSTLKSFKGIKLKPMSYDTPDPPEDIDDFIRDKCRLGYK